MKTTSNTYVDASTRTYPGDGPTAQPPPRKQAHRIIENGGDKPPGAKATAKITQAVTRGER